MRIKLLDAAIATNGPPSLATHGWPLRGTVQGGSIDTMRAHLLVASTAGSGAMTVTLKLWGWFDGDIDRWFPLGTHQTAATKGVANQGNAIAITSVDSIRHAEVFEWIPGISRIYAEVTAIGGTSTGISAWLVGIEE